MQHKKSITSYNNKGTPHGYWKKYYPHSDRLFFTCYFIVFKNYGPEEIYDSNEILRNKTYYAR